MAKYWDPNPVHYGYIINAERATQLTLIHNPTLLARAERDGIEKWADVLLSGAVRWLRRTIPLPGLSGGIAWVGHGRKGPCFTFPTKMMKPYRTPEDAQRLEKFKEIMGLGDEPMIMASTDGPEPARYKTMNTPQFVIDWTFKSFLERCRKGEVTVAKLLADAGVDYVPDIQRLSLKDDDDAQFREDMEALEKGAQRCLAGWRSIDRSKPECSEVSNNTKPQSQSIAEA
ncbi:hypothetical protein AcV5_000764 [Taiwanofungus camphoratus]|nr:hypothetical protein AcV5_000764 [Antrodia cinnamomea]KAI0939306.1 hypothetical protein AcV5_000764 [Antrodia cinnamomea]